MFLPCAHVPRYLTMTKYRSERMPQHKDKISLNKVQWYSCNVIFSASTITPMRHIGCWCDPGNNYHTGLLRVRLL